MASFDNGHVKIFRKMLDWEWFNDINTFYVFMYCLLKANWKDKKWHGMDVKRGSFVTSRRHMAKDLQLTEQEIRTALNHLETTNEITRSTTSKYSVITVVKFNEYQSANPQNNHKSAGKTTDKQPADAQVITTTEESKEEKNKKNTKKNKPPHRGWVLAEVWNARWWYDHHPDDGWVVEEIDGVKWGHKVKT